MISASKLLLSKQYNSLNSISKFSVNSIFNKYHIVYNYSTITTINKDENTTTTPIIPTPITPIIDTSSSSSSTTTTTTTTTTSTITTDTNNVIEEPLVKTKKIKIKIKSKDPFLLLSNNKKIYFNKKPKINKKDIQDQQQQFLHDNGQIPFDQQISQMDFINQQPLIDTNFHFNHYNHGVESFLNNSNIIDNYNSLNDSMGRQSSSSEIKNGNSKLIKDSNINIVNNNSNNNKTESTTTATITTTNIESTETIKNIEESIESTESTIIKKQHTVLIDGTLMAYKAYSTPLLTSGDKNINVIYGFTRSLLKVIGELGHIDNIIVCFDPKGGNNFRRDIYPEYKANRPPTPQDLIEQLAMIPEVTSALGIKFTVQDGFECDDLLATYSKHCTINQIDKSLLPHRVTIVTDDKDLFQLVNENVNVYSSRSGLTYGINDVIDKFGFEPNKFVTYQSLIGDKVDNIPGISKLGPKTATDIIKQFGNLTSILENVDQLPSKFIQPIKSSIDQLKTSYQLAKLNDNVTLDIPLSDIQFKAIDKSKLFEFLDKYQFKSIKESIGKYKLKFINNGTTEDEVNSTTTTTAAYSKVEFNYIDEENDQFESMEQDEINKLVPFNVTMVRDVETAKKVVDILMTQKDRYHACDTEVIQIDLKKVSPIGHGKMICFSIYCGPQVKFHDGNSRVWVDVMDDINGSDILNVFKNYFEDESILKVWHNYAFDRHIFYNHGINVRGFGGDTLHMARLWNASRTSTGGYSLEALSRELLGKDKIPIKDLFGSKKIKANGEEGKAIVIPPLERIQRDKKTILNWIEYSSLDSELTWILRENIQQKLREMEWNQGTTMWDFYYLMWRPFGHLLTEMEQRGLKVDIDYLKSLEQKAYSDIEENRKVFTNWAISHSPGAQFMNPDSDAQIQQLLFAPIENRKTKERLERDKEFECDNFDQFIEPGKSKPKKKKLFTLSGIGMTSKSLTTGGWPSVDSSSLRELAGKSPEQGKYGSAYQFFIDKSKSTGSDVLSLEEAERLGKEASIALNALLELGSIGTLLNTFIIPLQKLADSNSRLHTSVNVNTETGRLSSKKPNLQNQPALEKDRYKIRKAFTCEPGNVLIVADYGQLELRLLAHITNCKSMINAFHVGGDFHSRTAMGMYPHVKEAVDKGEVLLEWDGDGEPPKPLLKNVYASERRKAKTLNFSIAYGKTAHGLSQDWGVTLKEAQETLNRWYEDRPEVLVWQRKTIAQAHKFKWTRTLMGRYRQLPDIDNNAKGMKGHAERASINTPLQGGAADIVMKAMLIIEDNQRLRELGYKMIMQIHDELILEGPEQHAQEARTIMMNLMSNPLTTPLLIDLVVDCRFAKTWYDAK